MNLAELESQLPNHVYFKSHERQILNRTAAYTNELFQKALETDTLTIGGHGIDH